MKKYITLAALLAAGTACAGAVTLEDADIIKGGNTGYDSQSGVFTIALTLDVDALRTYLERGQPLTSWGTDIVRYVCNGTSTGVTINGSSQNNKINNSGLYARWGDDIAWNPSQSQDVVWSGGTNLATLDWNAIDYAGLVYVFDKTNGTSVAFQLLKEDDVTGEKTAVVDSYVTASGLKSSSAGAAALTFGDMVASSYYFNEGYGEADVKTLLSAVATAAPVPEPSAFGMLAGLGALALVAARRRRK